MAVQVMWGICAIVEYRIDHGTCTGFVKKAESWRPAGRSEKTVSQGNSEYSASFRPISE